MAAKTRLVAGNQYIMRNGCSADNSLRSYLTHTQDVCSDAVSSVGLSFGYRGRGYYRSKHPAVGPFKQRVTVARRRLLRAVDSARNRNAIPRHLCVGGGGEKRKVDPPLRANRLKLFRLFVHTTTLYLRRGSCIFNGSMHIHLEQVTHGMDCKGRLSQCAQMHVTPRYTRPLSVS